MNVTITLYKSDNTVGGQIVIPFEVCPPGLDCIPGSEAVNPESPAATRRTTIRNKAIQLLTENGVQFGAGDKMINTATMEDF
jgi:hypothetical protein